jgi:hypothetical protein
MKLRFLALVVFAALLVVGVAYASRTATVKSISLTPGMAVGYAGLTCTAYAGTTPTNANLVCVRNNLAGFGVVVSQSEVIVAKSVSGKIQVVFRKANS